MGDRGESYSVLFLDKFNIQSGNDSLPYMLSYKQYYAVYRNPGNE